MATQKKLSELAKGTWNDETLYTVGDITDHNGSSYISIKNGTNQEPPNAEYWALLAEKGEEGEKGETGASIVSASFVDDDMVFTKDDASTVAIPEAKTDLTGPQGLPGDPGQDGDDGREVELQKSATHIQWRYVGEETWNDLVALVDLKGADGEDGTDGTDGREIELQKTDTYIQWRYADDVSWTNLVALADLKGDKGDTGEPGTSFVWKGEWDSETLYEANEAVEHNGSSYIAIAPNTNSEPPSANWELMAQKGLDGEGAGDVIGPASAVSNNFVAFNGVTGKLIKDSGKKAADFETAGAAAAVQSDLDTHKVDTSAHGVSGNIVGTTDTQTITNKTIDGDQNTLSNLPVSAFKTASQAQGDILYFNGTNWVRLPAGTAGHYLKTQGAGANPIWAPVTTGVGVDGWTAAGETWTYASATTFTVSGDVRSKYPKGTKIKLTQSSTTKYFYVIGTSYSSPNTTVTITGGSNYSLANATITDNYYSYMETPVGFPSWFNYTPIWRASTTMPNIGNGTIAGKFSIKGELCSFYATVKMGSTTTYGSGFYYVQPPFKSDIYFHTYLAVSCFDYSALLTIPGYAQLDYQTTGESGNRIFFTPNGRGTPTVPFTWGENDELTVTGTYFYSA